MDPVTAAQKGLGEDLTLQMSVRLTGDWVVSSCHEGKEEVGEPLKLPHIGLLVCPELQCLKGTGLQ